MATPSRKKDQVRYYRPDDIPGMVLGEAHFTDFSFEPHFHLDYHIGLIAEGAQRQRFAGQNGVLAAGRISIMPPGEVHTGTPENSNAYSLRTFRVAPALLDSLAEEFSGHRQTLALRPEIIESPHLSQHLTALHQQMTLNTGAAGHSFDEQYLATLEPLFVALNVAKQAEEISGLSTAHWGRIEEYCYAHLAEKISLSEMAGLCGLNRFQFLRHFSQRTGMTPYAWLKRLRLEVACGWLNKPGRSIAEVATSVGFYDQSHFNRAFRQAFGVAPSAY
ncbi:helix-turn-helix transcriptional regulator [Ewingella americana]|nr:AraC family transcriptional regulator [Ewingella americana]